MGDFWHGRRVLVTGAGGLIGSWAAAVLAGKGARVTATVRPGSPANLTPRSNLTIAPCDLESADACSDVTRGQQAVFSFAHSDGSAEFKRKHPASLFRRNIAITINLMEAGARHGVERMLITSSAEVYSGAVPVPAVEAAAFQHLEDTLGDGYSWSKRMTEMVSGLYAKEYGIRLAIARPSNIYGPGDSFDPARGRVIPTFIGRIFAGEPITLWGDGRQIRTFLYVEDFVRGAVDLLERGAHGGAVNFAGTEEISIAELAQLIAKLLGRPATLRFDQTKPAGVLRRVLDVGVAARTLQFQPRVRLEDGLRQTIDSFIATQLQHATTH